MAEYIEREALIDDIEAAMDNGGMGYSIGQTLKRYVKRQPSADVVSSKTLNQVMWERDLAIEQLESYGVGLGQKADVAPVVHGKWDDRLDGITPYCSVCGMSHSCMRRTPLYCPNCGAKMDLEGVTMGKCRDCLHFEVCKKYDAIVDFDVDDGVCLYFEKKIVRCIDCKYLEISGCYGECGMARLGIVHPDDYCSRGERKE